MQCSRRLSSGWRCFRHPYAPFIPPTNPKSRQPRVQNVVWPRAKRIECRHFSLSSIPTVLLPPVVFSGLLITLWTYKCLMMIVFQNKIIYMPSMPPFSRSETVEDYANECKPVVWNQHSIRSSDGIKLKLLEGNIPEAESADTIMKHIIVFYFQGNASSLPPRLPYLSNILKILSKSGTSVKYSIVALSYRGFWQSSGSPNQPGIELDAQAVFEWASDYYRYLKGAKFIIWGQSIGAGVATTSLATWLSKPETGERTKDIHISGLLLETPFTSLRAMLIELYPQKFLPYRYLGPFLKSTWDSEAAFTKIGRVLANTGEDERRVDGERSQLRVLLLEAGEDELVPKGDAARLLTICHNSKVMDAEHKVVSGALHTNVMMKSEGKKEIVSFLRRFEPE